ncbi:hypothetical protein Tco_0017442 [Tanacetum coccineum]
MHPTLHAPIKARCSVQNLEEQIHLGDGRIYGDRGAGSYVVTSNQLEFIRKARILMNKRMPGRIAHGAQIQNFEMADYVLREIHAGSCSMHSGPRSVVARRLTDLCTMAHNAHRDCARHEKGNAMIAKGRIEILIVAIDYFTKWIEAKSRRHNHREIKIESSLDRRLRVSYNGASSGRQKKGDPPQKWEGPSRFTEALGKGAYKLRDMDGNTHTVTTTLLLNCQLVAASQPPQASQKFTILGDTRARNGTPSERGMPLKTPSTESPSQGAKGLRMSDGQAKIGNALCQSAEKVICWARASVGCIATVTRHYTSME